MPYRIEFKASAIRELHALPMDVQKRIVPRIDALASDPLPSGCRKIAGEENHYRIRIGEYRVVYEVRKAVLIVVVIRVGHRREVYR